MIVSVPQRGVKGSEVSPKPAKDRGFFRGADLHSHFSWPVVTLSVEDLPSLRGHAMGESGDYRHLRPKPGSNYKQLFVGRIRAEVLYRETVGPEPLSPEEVAKEYNVPVDAVLEAIDYCTKNEVLLAAERAQEWERIRATGHDRWPYAPENFKPEA